MLARLLALVLALVLVACESPIAGLGATPTPTCEVQAAVYAVQIDSIAREWDDANTLAGQTPRASLSVQIDKLQAIRRKAQDQAPPTCAQAAHTALVGAMDKAIEAYLAFLGQRSDAEVSLLFEEANTRMITYGREIAKLTAPPATAVP
jgi:hypothetical protein